MSLGFNSKVQLGEGFYHVQTEDRGADHPFIDTMVLLSGQVLHRRSVSYEDLLVDGAADQAVLRIRVERQHRDVLAALRAGSLPLEKPAQTGNAAIQVKLCNASSWLAAGKVALEIEVCSRGEGRAVDAAEVEAAIESAEGVPVRFQGKTDAQGRLRLEFALPQLMESAAAALVILARSGRAEDRLRYNLKATPRVPAPAAPVPPNR